MQASYLICIFVYFYESVLDICGLLLFLSITVESVKLSSSGSSSKLPIAVSSIEPHPWVYPFIGKMLIKVLHYTSTGE